MQDKPARMSRKTTPVDLRARKTRNALSGALITLSSERQLDDVRALDISKAAKVGRSTFYAHFDDKEDFLAKSFADLIRRMDAEQLSRGPAKHIFPSELYFKHAANAKAYAHALAHSEAYVKIRLRNESTVRTIVLHNLNRMKVGTAKLRAKMATMLSGAFMSLAHQWMLSGLKEGPEELHAAFTRLCSAAIESIAQE